MCIGGSVESVTVEVEEEETMGVINFQKLRRRTLILDSKDVVYQAEKDGIPIINIGKLYEKMIEINNNRRGDPYGTSKISIQNYGALLHKEGLYRIRIHKCGKYVVMFAVGDLLDYIEKELP